ncbi:MAG: hypothetical protein ACR2IV_17465 [Bryobacteraceae bacterium]
MAVTVRACETPAGQQSWTALVAGNRPSPQPDFGATTHGLRQIVSGDLATLELSLRES